METKREKFIETLEKKFKLKFVSTSENFSGSSGGVWVAGDNREKATDGRLLFDYYAEAELNKYIFGIHVDFNNFCEKKGYYCEWHDCGTLMLWPN